MTTFNWTLEEPKSVTGFNLTTRQLELILPNDSYELAGLGLNFTPADATDKGVDITVRDTSIISYFDDGQAIVYKDVVDALKEGSTYVVFTTHDGGFKDSCLVTVRRVDLTDFSLSLHEKTLWLPYTQAGEYININDTSALRVIYTPANATDKSYSVAVRNKGVVKYDGNGLRAMREGSTYVVFTAKGGLQDSILINVTRTTSGGSPCESAATAQLGENQMPAAEDHTEWFTFTPTEASYYALSIVVWKYPYMEAEVFEGDCNALYLISDADRLWSTYNATDNYGAGFYGAAGQTYRLKLFTYHYNTQGGGEIVPYTWRIDKISASVSGTVTDNGSPAQGTVELYSIKGNSSAVLEQRADIQANGSYSFTGLGLERYFVKAVSAAGNFAYSGNATHWQSAQTIYPPKSQAYTGIDIDIVHQEAIQEGTAKISGYVFSSEDVRANTIRRATSLRSAGNPAANVTVLLRRNANLVTYTQTDGNGYFEFTGMGAGEYVVVVDIPGLEMDDDSPIVISAADQSVELEYEVSETGIFNNTTAIEAIATDRALRIFPNPVKDELHIVGLRAGETVGIFDISGRIVMNDVPVNAYGVIPVSGLPKGIYFVRIGSVSIKIIKI